MESKGINIQNNFYFNLKISGSSKNKGHKQDSQYRISPSLLIRYENNNTFHTGVTSRIFWKTSDQTGIKLLKLHTFSLDPLLNLLSVNSTINGIKRD
jgi:hypothetical protein